MSEKTVNECYGYNTDTRERLNKLEERHDELAKRVFDKLETIEDKLVSRLPIWATLLIAVLMSAVGWLLSKVAI